MDKEIFGGTDIRDGKHDDDRDKSHAKTARSVGRRKSDIKKNNIHLHKGVKEKARIIKQLSGKHDIKLLCRVLKLPRSSYYAALSRPPSKRELYNRELKVRLLELYHQSGKLYGCIKLRHLLLDEGYFVSQNKVLRLMRELDIRSVVVRKYRHYRPSVDNTPRENLVARHFTAPKPNQVWLSDITYIHTVKNGWTYLASILDVCTRKIVGYSYSRRMTVDLTIRALQNACRNQGYPENVILHSDRGSQYTAADYIQKAGLLNITLSFSSKGYPYDNAPMEAFHSLLKKEEVYQTRYYDFDYAKCRLFDYIEGFYNRNRIHSAIGFKSPLQFEMSFLFQ